MRAALRWPLLVLATTTALACGATAAPDSPAETATDDVRGGRVELGYPEVGHLRSARGLVCTGTLVAEEWVLTAAHCVEPANAVTEFVIGERPRRIASAAKHPTYRGEAPSVPMQGIDVAVIRLDDRVTDVRPAALSAVGDVASRNDLFVRSIGFGLDDERTSGTKRSAVEWITSIDEENIATHGLSGSTDRGDSGGPVYLGRSIVAVTSRGFGVSLSARVDAARAWLDESTEGKLSWVPIVTGDPHAARDVCERAASRLCARADEERAAAHAQFLASCMDAYTTCGHPPAFAACTVDASKCDHVARCLMLPTNLCLAAVPPERWDDEVRVNACDEYARAREACDGGRRDDYAADCSRRFATCGNRLPEAVRCELRERQACAPSRCLERPHCL